MLQVRGRCYSLDEHSRTDSDDLPLISDLLVSAIARTLHALDLVDPEHHKIHVI